MKYNYMLQKLCEYSPYDEDKGILKLTDIEEACRKVFSEYDVNACILFGSYARGEAGEKSDVDLVVVTEVTGLKFFGMAERLREALHKKVDLLDFKQLNNNTDLLFEVLTDGVKVYEKE